MNKYTKTKLVLFFGIFFIASLSADPLLHDHIDEQESESIVECQLCENKTFDLKNSDSEISELIQISFIEELFFTFLMLMAIFGRSHFFIDF